MAIEPEGMDRKEKGKEGMVKRVEGMKFCKWNRFWTSNSNLSYSSAYSPFHPFFSNLRKPPFIPSHHLANRSLFSFFVLFSPTGQNHSFSSLIPLLHGPITLFLYGKSLYFNPFPPIHPSSRPRFIPARAAASPWQYKVPPEQYVTDEFLFGWILTVGKIYIDIYSSQTDRRVMFFGWRLLPFSSPYCERSAFSTGYRNRTVSRRPSNVNHSISARKEMSK